ncbi:hypothetical protein PMAYCL1PPCAC_24342, partial [Pristionchus mayeri]
SSLLSAMEYLLESEVQPITLTFIARKERQESYFDVSNKGEMHQIYKIKTNNVKGYKISPSQFSIGVNERKRVFVSFLGLREWKGRGRRRIGSKDSEEEQGEEEK